MSPRSTWKIIQKNIEQVTLGIIKIIDLNGKTIHKPKFRTKGHTGRLEYKYPYLDIAVMNPNNRGTFKKFNRITMHWKTWRRTR